MFLKIVEITHYCKTCFIHFNDVASKATTTRVGQVGPIN
jgi:hypothetical protein